MKKEIRLIIFVSVMIIVFLTSIRMMADVDMWPLYEKTKDSQTVCYPLYCQDKDFKMILNFYVKSNNGKDTHIFWPFIKFSEGRLSRVAPFWFSDNSSEYVLLPFLIHNSHGTLWTIPPVYVDQSKEVKAVIPFYIKGEDEKYIFPNIVIGEDDESKSLNVFPIFKNYASKLEKGKKTLWFLLYEYLSEPSKELQRYSVYPFGSVQNSPEKSFVWLLNYYSSLSPTGRSLKVYPFFGVENKKLQEKRTYNKFWLMWPFYSREEVINAEGEVLSSKKEFLIFSNEKRMSGKRTFSILGFVVRERLD